MSLGIPICWFKTLIYLLHLVAMVIMLPAFVIVALYPFAVFHAFVM